MERHLLRNLNETVVKAIRLLQSSASKNQMVCKPSQFLKSSLQECTMLTDPVTALPVFRSCHAYAALLEGVAEQQSLEEKYGKGELSIEASARRVGLGLPTVGGQQQTPTSSEQEN